MKHHRGFPLLVLEIVSARGIPSTDEMLHLVEMFKGCPMIFHNWTYLTNLTIDTARKFKKENKWDGESRSSV